MMNSPQSSIAAETDDDSKGDNQWHNINSKSLTDSVKDYTYANGRRYHAYHSGAYMLPNDEAEQNRMEMMHHIWKELQGGEVVRLAPENPKRILDVGTGTGSWAIEAADRWVLATVIGTDLSPIQPSLVPENCHFYVEDAESDWQWEQPFDFIHGRALMGAIKDWPRFYQQCFENLEPGGQIEMQEHDGWIFCAPTGRVPPWIAQWNVNLNEAYKSWGKSLHVADKHVQWMSEAGFVDVDDQVHQTPIGPWAKDPRLKELGKWNLAQLTDIVEPYTLAMYTAHLGMSYEQTRVAIEMIRKEFREKKNHLIGRYHFITGKKPSN